MTYTVVSVRRLDPPTAFRPVAGAEGPFPSRAAAQRAAEAALGLTPDEMRRLRSSNTVYRLTADRTDYESIYVMDTASPLRRKVEQS